MKSKKTIRQMFGSILAVFLVTSCSGVIANPTPTSTLLPTLTSTPTFTFTPTTTPTAISGVGVPVNGTRFEITILEARQQDKLDLSVLFDLVAAPENILAPVDSTFLVVGLLIRVLDNSQDRYYLPAITVFGGDGQEYNASAVDLFNSNHEWFGLGDGEEGVEGVSLSATESEDLGLAFLVKKSVIGQEFKLRFEQVHLISFTVQ